MFKAIAHQQGVSASEVKERIQSTNHLHLPQARLPQNDCGDFRRTAGYGRSYASAGRADDP